MAEVRVQEGEPLENAMRRFKRKVQQEDIIKEVKRHSFYLKPGEKRRTKQALARKRNRKKAAKSGMSKSTTEAVSTLTARLKSRSLGFIRAVGDCGSLSCKHGAKSRAGRTRGRCHPEIRGNLCSLVRILG